MHEIEIFQSYSAVRLKLTEYPKTREELAQITIELTAYVREFIGDFQMWFDLSSIESPPAASVFEASRASSMYGKLLGFRRAVVQVNAKLAASVTLGNMEKEKLEDQKIAVSVVHSATEALDSLGAVSFR